MSGGRGMTGAGRGRDRLKPVLLWAEAGEDGLHRGAVVGKAGENARDERLAIDVATGVAVVHELEGGLIFRVLNETVVKTCLDHGARAIRHVEALGNQAGAEVLPEDLRTVFTLLNPPAIEYVAHKLRIYRDIEGQRGGEAGKRATEIFQA